MESERINAQRLPSLKAEFVETELDVLNVIIDRVVQLDPDIIAGWEVQAASWGYLSARGRAYGEPNNSSVLTHTEVVQA